MDVNSLGPEAGLVHGAGLATYEYHLSLRTNGERTEDSIHVKDSSLFDRGSRVFILRSSGDLR